MRRPLVVSWSRSLAAGKKHAMCRQYGHGQGARLRTVWDNRMRFLRPCRGRSTSSKLTTTLPPDDLLDGHFERPTPILVVAGECQAAQRWSEAALFLSARGCTVGTIPLCGRGSAPTETLTLKALQTGVAAALDESGFTPPVIIAHSMAGFVCQQYLQSHPAAGLVLLDSFPPNPSAIARLHLSLARVASSNDEISGERAGDRHLEALAQRMRDDPLPWQEPLRRSVTGVDQLRPWQTVPSSGDSAEDPAFPVRAFAQMCLDHKCSEIRLEQQAVRTLVLGSAVSRSHLDRQDSDRFRCYREQALEAICDFHGTDAGWKRIDDEGFGSSSRGPVPWLEMVWDWYHKNF